MVGLFEKNPASDKEMDAMAWVGYMNMLRAMAEGWLGKWFIHNVNWNQLVNRLVSLSAKLSVKL